ncbi:DUF3093 domain-containing protein [Cellulosimicrobium protaetiae]|uniref:DUF3093 family protein n=1 Tax=Cellulosimicrobium protaetiae TaxID=2587808 RepID=A0A6M5UII7_9MICO|nr:DUF3093 domain-containing protein [Cellulosimicrobium protaetiae]QJW36938.1 DUF3093 family protein [Cellulosimicrobium protaetiae]
MTDAADRSTSSSAPGGASGEAAGGASGGATTSGTPGAASYRERLLPGVGGWAATLGFAAVLGIALWPASHAIAIGVGVLAAVAGVVGLWWTSPVVAVVDGELCAGRAHVPTSLLGQITTLDAETMRVQLGPRLDARAFVCLRAWARTGVHVTLEDPLDPTPYWLVSTRHPQRLADAIRTAQAS